MAKYTINNLTALTSPAVGDYVPVWNVAGGATKKVTLTNLFAAVMATANTFTAVQTFAPTATNADGITIIMPNGSTSYAIRVRDSALSSKFFVAVDLDETTMFLNGGDFGSNLVGPSVRLTRNTNATKPGAAYVSLMNRAGTAYRIWPDASGNLRIHTADPIYDNDGLGTVVGAQTSNLESKLILGDVGDAEAAVQAIVAASKTLKTFVYRSGAFNGEVFEGVVTDYAPRYGMDRDADHPHGKSLNEIQLFGDLIRAVALLAEKVGLV